MIGLLTLVISHETMAFGKKATSTPAPATVVAPSPAKPTVDYDESFEYQGDEELAAKPAVKPAKKIEKKPVPSPVIAPVTAPKLTKPTTTTIPKPAASVISAEKQQELAAIAFLKKDFRCGKSAQPGVSTTGDANSIYRLKNVYTQEAIPKSVRKLISQQVDRCDKDRNVGKYYQAPKVEQASKPAEPVVVATPEPAIVESKPVDVVNDSAKKIGDFFGKLSKDITTNGVKEKVCSPAETQMHVNGC